MIAELGHFALILAFAVSLFQASIPLYGAHRGWPAWMEAARPAAVAQFGPAFLIGNNFLANDREPQ